MKRIIYFILAFVLTISMCSGALYADEVVFEGEEFFEDNISEETVFEDPSSWDEEYVEEESFVIEEEYVSDDSSHGESAEERTIWEDDQYEEEVSYEAGVTYDYDDSLNGTPGSIEEEIISEKSVTDDPSLEKNVYSFR